MTTCEHQTKSAVVESVRVSRIGIDIVVEESSCGACPPCRVGFGLWCASPAGPREALRMESVLGAECALRSITAAAALAGGGTPATGVILALDSCPGDPGDPLALGRLAAVAHAGALVRARDAGDASVRGELARLSELGRPDAVVTTGGARAAVKAVRRGGTVFIPAAPLDSPSVTELVQREVRLVGARDLRPLLDALADAGVPA